MSRPCPGFLRSSASRQRGKELQKSVSRSCAALILDSHQSEYVQISWLGFSLWGTVARLTAGYLYDA